MFSWFIRFRLLILVLPVLLIPACLIGASTDELDPAHLDWVTYRDRQLGYSFSYPEKLSLNQEKPGNVMLRYGRRVVALVRFMEAEEGEGRGLWFGHEPVEQTNLGSVPAQKYVYEHWDGPFSSKTIAYVIPYHGKFLALELRADNEPSEIQQKILSSFQVENAG